MKHYFSSNKTSLITHQGILYCKKNIADVALVLGIINYFLWTLRKKSGKNKRKLRAIYHFIDSCQEKSVNS